MIVRTKPKSRSSVLETYSMYLLVAWTIIIVGILLFGIFQIRHIQQEMVKKEAQANFNKDQALRFWATTHGGVYVPTTETTPSNPYLSHVKERDIRAPDGKALTLMNPAYMMRQTMEEYEILYGVRGHLTSLKYFRPETAPDEWEKLALQKFNKGTKEMSEFTEIDGKPYYRYMSPMITKIGCLKCHGHQGYEVGDIRGGVSVSIPMTPYLINQRKQTVTLAVSMTILWFLGFYGLILANRGLKGRVRERDRAEAKLQKAHDKLEWKVKERTSELYNELQERKKAEESLRISQLRYSRIEERLKNKYLFFTRSIDGEMLYISPGSEAISGLSPNEIVGKNWKEVVPWTPEALEQGIKADERFRSGESIRESTEMPIHLKDGGLRYLFIDNYALKNDDGFTTKIEGYIQENSEAKFSHSLCQECAKEHYPDFDIYDD